MAVRTTVGSRPKVVMIRGDWLCRRDTQYYEPLMDRYDFVGVSVRRTVHDLSLIPIPVVTPWSPDSLLARLGPVQAILDRVLRLRSENLMYFLGLHRVCEAADVLDVAETFHPFCRQAVNIKLAQGVKLVFRVHENIPFAHSNLSYRRHTKKLVFDHADAFITCSRMGRQTLEMEGAPPERIHVIPIGIDTDLYKPAAKNRPLMAELRLTESDFVVLFAARMVWEKGVVDLLNAAAALKARVPELRLVLVGDGPESEALGRRMTERGIAEIIRTAGRVPSTRMRDIYSIADVVAVPSITTPRWQEQFGAVLIEAMACGRALVASDCGAIPEVVGDAGLIVPQGNYLALAEAIARLHCDRPLLRSLGEAGRRRAAEKFSNRVVADQVDSVYNALVTARHRR